GTELIGPFIAKRMIDVHISGIEQPWHQVQRADEASVAYDGALWKRADKFAADEVRGAEARVLQVGRTFVFVPGVVEHDGQRRFTLGTGAAGAAGDAAGTQGELV